MMHTIKTYLAQTLYGNIATILLRLLLGLLFVYSGFWKIIDLEGFAEAIGRFNMLPEILIPYAAILLAPLEFVIGLSFLVGFKIKSASSISIFLMIIFIIAIGFNMLQGKIFECGCFGSDIFGFSEKIGWSLLLRDIFWLIVSIIIFQAEKHLFSLDNYIETKKLSSL
jgi:uncharacterized membrane protein YphA (DoxX/SURF4 family)